MRRAAAVVMVAGLAVTACTGGDDGGGERVDFGAQGLDFELAAALTPFDACEDFLAYFHDNADQLLDQYGHGFASGGGFAVAEDGVDVASPGVPDRATGEDVDDFAPAGEPLPATGEAGGQADPGAPVAGEDFSTTNVQEEGVDEPDIVKTDGERLFALAGGTLRAVDVTGDEPVELGSLPLDAYGGTLLMQGDTVLVLGSAGEGGVGLPEPLMDRMVAPEFYRPYTSVRMVDVSDPSQMEVASTLTVEGSHVSARMIDGIVRVVVQTPVPQLDFVVPGSGTERSREIATEANRQLIQETTADDFLPHYTVEDAGGSTTEGALLECSDVSHPSQFSGLGMLSVMTFDIDDRTVGETVGVVATGEQVYASADNLYVATNRALPIEVQTEGERDIVERFAEEFRTDIHKFDLSDATRAEYRASGQVRGTVLNQYSMSEFDGDLRVATTDGAPWFTTEQSESFVSVLREQDGQLVQVGQVGDLGRGERIFAVRYVGDKAFVVTFRQTDPLYTVDLADPTAPAVLGELKINGYSAYLHPIDEPGYLLGVGQDATDEGFTTGTQVSLFDVTDLANPTRVAQANVEGGSSQVEFDARAFLYWAADDLAVIPVEVYRYEAADSSEAFFGGVIGFRVTTEGITEVGRISHPASGSVEVPIGIPVEPPPFEAGGTSPGSIVAGSGTEPAPPPDELVDPVEPGFAPVPYTPPIQRAVVIGDSIYTLSETGLLRSDRGSFAAGGFVAFA